MQVGVDTAPVRGERLRGIAWVRGPALPFIVAGAVWVLFAANFLRFGTVRRTDAEVNYDFLQELFGENVDPLVAYQFGLAFLWAPFYAIGKGLGAAGAETVAGVTSEEAMLEIGSIFYVLLTLVVTIEIVRRLDLPRPALTSTLALFGAGLFFWGSFVPLRTHPQEAFLLALVLLLLLALFRSTTSRPGLCGAIGLVLGLTATVRWFNAALAFAAVVGLFLFRSRRETVIVAGATALTAGLLVLVPIGLGVPLFIEGGYSSDSISFSPGSLPQMLFSDYRGLFVWTPLTVLGVVGYVRLLRRRSPDRPFLATAAAMGIALSLMYELYSAWGAGWSYSARYLSPLYPLFAIGLAGLWGWRPRIVATLAGIALAWSLFLALYVGLPFGDFGFDTGKASQLGANVVHGKMTPGRLSRGVWDGSRIRHVVGG